MQADTSQPSRPLRIAVIAGLVTATLTIGIALAGPGDEHLDRFCTLEGRIDQPTARRDPAKGCNWVDEEGNLIP